MGRAKLVKLKAKHSLVVAGRPKNGIVSLEETPFNVRIANGDTSHFSTNFPSVGHTLSCCSRDKLVVSSTFNPFALSQMYLYHYLPFQQEGPAILTSSGNEQ